MSRFRGAAGMSVTRMFVCALVRCFDMEAALTAATEQAQHLFKKSKCVCCVAARKGLIILQSFYIKRI